MEESDVTVTFPTREWAEWAMVDLEGLGCRSMLVAAPFGFQLQVTGPVAIVERIRLSLVALDAPPAAFDWRTFINGCSAQPDDQPH